MWQGQAEILSQQELSKKWFSALAGGPPIQTNSLSLSPTTGHHDTLNGLLSIRETYTWLPAFLSYLIPSKALASRNPSKEERKKLHLKSSIHPPGTWLPQNGSQSQITASQLCCQCTRPLRNAHCLGTTCQLRGRCLFTEGSYPRTKEMVCYRTKHAPNCTKKPALGPEAGPEKEACRESKARRTSVGSDLRLLHPSLPPPPAPSPKRSFNTLLPLKSWGFGDSPGTHMVPMSPWPLHGREAGKTNESSCNSAAPEFRPARQKGLQACSQIRSGTWHAKAIFNHWIYFFPSPSTILHLSKCIGKQSTVQINSRCAGKPRKALPFQDLSQQAEPPPGSCI